MARALTLMPVVQPLLRAELELERNVFADAVAAAAVGKNGNGGSLPARIRKLRVRVRKGVGTIPYRDVGPHLSFLLSGVKPHLKIRARGGAQHHPGQPARPATSTTDAEGLASSLARATVAAIQAFDREAS